MSLRPRRPQPQSAASNSSRSGSTRKKSTRSQPTKGKGRPRRPSGSSESADLKSGERLQKLLAAAGLGSRRACEELILTGRVEVDRQIVSTLGTRVDPVSQEIRVDGEPLPRPRATYVLVNKVQGVLSTSSDPSGRPRVTDMVPPNLGRLFPVGRLDMSSEGLILLTNDGELANRMTHPRYGIEKMYHVQVAGHIEPETLRELEKGIYLAEGVAKVVGASIKSHHKNSTILEMILDEGRNREIRRLLARVGHKVQRLTRVAMGPLKLGDVPPGAYRILRHDEIDALKSAVEEVPIGKRATKKPKSNPSGSRKLLQQRKSGSSGASEGKPSRETAEQASGGNRPAGHSKGKPQQRKSSGNSTASRPKPRTVIGDDNDFGSGTSFERKTASSAAGSDKKKSKYSPSRGAKSSSSGKFGSAKPGGGKKPGTRMKSPGQFGSAQVAKGNTSGASSYGDDSEASSSRQESSSSGTRSGGSSRGKKAFSKKPIGAKSSAGKQGGYQGKRKSKPGVKTGRTNKK